MRPKTYDLDPIDADPNGIAESQTLGAAGNVVLNGSRCDVGTAAQFDIGDEYSSGVGGVKIEITSGGDESDITFTVTGKDSDGKTQTEAITGPNNSTVTSTLYWSQITQIAADGAVGNAITIGTADELVTKTIPIDARSDSPMAISVDVTGTINFSAQETLEDVQQGVTFYPQQHAAWHDIGSSESVDAVMAATLGARAIRLLVNSYSSGAELQMHLSQPTGR